jgi:phosphopantothenoylcysteine decarboxylase/phosphopantothenate--cysteine ligase
MPSVPPQGAAPGAEPSGSGAAAPERLLIGVSGSVAALALPTYLNAFRMLGVARMTLVITPAAEKFLPAATLRLACDTVHTETEHGPGHVALARWADQILVLPATAHLLGCAAQGLAPNLLATTLLAVERPVVFAPAMNPAMWRHTAVRRNVRRLREDGHIVADPVEGSAYEVASRSMRHALMLPSPQSLLEAACDTAQEAA